MRVQTNLIKTISFAALGAALLSACGPDNPQNTGGTGGGTSSGGGGSTTTSTGPDLSEELYAPDHVVEVNIEMAAADWDSLRTQSRTITEMLGENCQDGPHESPYTYFPANVTVDGQLLENSGVRKKGFLGSASLSKPSLKVSFDEYEVGREAFGVEGLTLNNSRQDPSFVKTCLAMKVFLDAGLPASRCNFAHVTVNGTDMGVYVNIEPVNKRMLARHFKDNTGNLYEGQLSDFRPGWSATYEKKTNEADPDRSDLDAVTDALTKPDGELESALGAAVDIDTFMKYWATETLTAAWDGYTNNLNNHFVYTDPSTGKTVFLPWGPDMSFDADDPFLPASRPQSVSAKGKVARRLYAVPAFQAKYVSAMNDLLNTAWKEDALLAEIDRIQKLIEPYLPGGSNASGPTDQVRSFVEGRRNVITAELSPNPPAWPFPEPAVACLSTVGKVAGTFSTTFGTLPQLQTQPFNTGDATFDIEIPLGMAQSASATGAAAGYENGANSRRRVIVIGAFAGGKTYALVFDVEPEMFAAGKDGKFDWQAVFAVGIDIVGPGQFETLGLFGDGVLHLDEAQNASGAPVSGTFEGTLLTSFLN